MSYKVGDIIELSIFPNFHCEVCMEVDWNSADCPICEKQEDLDQSIDLNEFEVKKVTCIGCKSEFELQKTDDNESWYGYGAEVKIIKICKTHENDNN